MCHKVLEALQIKVEEPILTQDDGHGAGELSDGEGIDGGTPVTGDDPQEDGGAHEDVQGVQEDLQFDEAEDLRHKNGRLGDQLQDTGQGDRVAGKLILTEVNAVHRREPVDPDVEARSTQNSANGDSGKGKPD